MTWLTLVLCLLAILALAALAPWLLGAKGRRSVEMAIRNLLLHKLRSFLSVLGIIIGTASVIVLMGFGEGNMRDALEAIKRQGATNIIVMTVKPPEQGAAAKGDKRIARYGLTNEDNERFAETLQPAVIATLPLRAFNAEIRLITDYRTCQGRVVATQARYADLYKLHEKVMAGRFLTEQDEEQGANVAVLGSAMAAELFPGSDPLRQVIKIKDRAFVVVGVLKDRAPLSGGSEIEKFNSDVYVPLRAWRERVGQMLVTLAGKSLVGEDVALSQIVVTACDTEHVRYAAELIRTQLRRSHDKPDVEVRVPLDRLEEAERTRARYRLLLFFIAGISLVVGGIGIMNIMLATVTERTREIGIRRALGATREDITFQFLVEAVVQTTLGGLVGVAAGFVLLFGVPAVHLFWQQNVMQVPASQLQTLPVQVHVPSVLLAFSVALAVGVSFGWYPSRRAALLDPIEALRHE